MKMLGNRILLKTLEDTPLSARFHIKAEPEYRAKVENIGEDVESVKIGDTVIYEKNAGTDLKTEANTYKIVTEDNIIAILEDE